MTIQDSKVGAKSAKNP